MHKRCTMKMCKNFNTQVLCNPCMIKHLQQSVHMELVLEILFNSALELGRLIPIAVVHPIKRTKARLTSTAIGDLSIYYTFSIEQ